MCECGCVGTDERYRFPGPGKSFYVLVLHGKCLNCYSPAGVAIERIDPGHALWKEFKRGEFLDGDLQFEKWPDCYGVSVVTGFLRDEFIKALSPHLVGVNSNELGEGGELDEIGAETILEEAYEDSAFKPKLLQEVKPAEGA